MSGIINELKQELACAEKTIDYLENSLKHKDKYFNSSIRVTDNHGNPQYYFRRPGDTKSHYVSQRDREKLRPYIQCDYEKLLYDQLIKNKRAIVRFLADYDDRAVQHSYDKLCDGRKQMIEPLETPDDVYIKQWLASHSGSQNPYPKENSFLTNRGESVRSKSEKIIADLLCRLNIPYRYEAKLILDGKYIVYPDFMILDVKKRRTIYLEHFGLMSDSVYALKALKRIGAYEKNGIIAGDNFIVSLESSDSPLDVKVLEKKIRKLIDRE